MVVRLKDLNNDSAPSTKKGLVRLSDLGGSSKADGPSAATINARGTAEADESRLINESRQNQIRANDFYKQQEEMNAADNPKLFQTDKNAMLGVKARNLPIIGSALRGLDSFATNPVVDKVADISRSFYLPGAGAANVAGLTSAAESGLAKYLPNFAESAAGKVISKFAIPGLPLGAGATLQNDPNASAGKVALGALEGAAFGAGLGAVGTAAGRGLTRLADIAPDLARNAIKNVAANTRTVASPFADDAVAGNAVARGYTENVGRSFGNGPSRVADDVASSRVIQPASAESVVSNTERLGVRTNV
jgi:hypothetical protein